ncbi:MAG: hypothetical protein ACFB3T_09280 [Geminicoccaceae bacterium]
MIEFALVFPIIVLGTMLSVSLWQAASGNLHFESGFCRYLQNGRHSTIDIKAFALERSTHYFSNFKAREGYSLGEVQVCKARHDQAHGLSCEWVLAVSSGGESFREASRSSVELSPYTIPYGNFLIVTSDTVTDALLVPGAQPQVSRKVCILPL